MKLNYYSQTDSLYIDLSARESVRSEIVAEGVVLDYDEEDQIVGIDIDNASNKVDLNEFSFSKIPFRTPVVTD